MTDLATVLPGLDPQPYAHLIPSLEKSLITTTDLLTLDVVEIAKRAKLPLLELKTLCNDVLQALQRVLEPSKAETGKAAPLVRTGTELVAEWNAISTLDLTIDRALGGGVPTRYITEITGESGAGKTQFLLTLLLAAQLAAPQGLSRSSLYISTESALPTTRLSQMLQYHPILSSADPKPSLDRVISIVTPDLESQDHILRYQLPVAIRRHNIGLVVIDSVAANYRAEFERPGAGRSGANMAKRSVELIKLGHLLRDLARLENIAIVVANQVADRFTGTSVPRHMNLSMSSPLLNQTQSSPLAHHGGQMSLPMPDQKSNDDKNVPSSSLVGPLSSSAAVAAILGVSIPYDNTNSNMSLPGRKYENFDAAKIMTLDHQQRFFTGWGDSRSPSLYVRSNAAEKTPSLGLVWTTQIACRIALIKKPVYGNGVGQLEADETDRGEPVLKKWRRWMRVVFAPWVEGGGKGVEFEIVTGGVRALKRYEEEREREVEQK